MNDYFTILFSSRELNSAEFQVCLNESCRVYEGHFPDKPIAPGACSIEMIRRLASQVLNKEIRFTTIKQCKFSALLVPDENQILNVEMKWENNVLQAVVMRNAVSAIRFKAIIL